MDSPDKAVEPKVEKTALMIIEAGGVIAWVIVGLGAVAMFLALLRLLGLLYHTLGRGNLAEKTAQLVSADGQFEEARNRLVGTSRPESSPAEPRGGPPCRPGGIGGKPTC